MSRRSAFPRLTFPQANALNLLPESTGKKAVPGRGSATSCGVAAPLSRRQTSSRGDSAPKSLQADALVENFVFEKTLEQCHLDVSDRTPKSMWGTFLTCLFRSVSSTLKTCSTSSVGNVFIGFRVVVSAE